MKQVDIQLFNIIGITVKTSNSDFEKLNHDMSSLWGRFILDDIINQIPNKLSNDIYCVYTDYEGDFTKPYTALLGCKVTTLDSLPNGLIGKTFNGGIYNKTLVKGDLTKGIVFDAWQEIWKSNFKRSYIADFEIYASSSSDIHNSEVEIFVG